MRSAIAIPVFLFLGHAAAQSGLQTCPSDCIASVFANPTGLGCAPGDQSCACKAGVNFNYAIRDCITQSCSTLTGDTLTTQINAAQSAAAVTCAVATSVPSTPTPTPRPSAPTSAAAPPTTTTVVSPVATSSAIPTTLVTSPATASATRVDGVSASAASNTASSSASKSSSQSSSSATASAAAASAADAAAASSSSSDLSVAAKAGIGAGAGVAMLLAGIILCYVLSKKRKAKGAAGGRRSAPEASRIPAMQISRPLPGSGRQYAQDVQAPMSSHSQYQQGKLTPSPASSTYSSKQGYPPSRPSRDDDHFYDVQARRYEDMVQRSQPRTMF